MNKWFASARDLSDSDSSGDSSDEEKKPTQTQQAVAATKKPNFDDSEESEEEQRTVLTQKDKQQSIMDGILKDVNNHLKINDFSALIQDFERYSEELQKDYDQQRGIIYQKALGDGVLPVQYLRVLVKIENSINETNQSVKEKKVNLNKTNSVALNKLKQKLKKYLQATGPSENTLEKQISTFRENPVWSEDERKAAKAQQKKAEETKKGAAVASKGEEKKGAAKKPAKDSDESSEESEEEEESEYDDEEEEESEEESSEEEEIDIFKIPREQMTPAQRRLKWVKFERLPQYLQDMINKKKGSKTTKEATAKPTKDGAAEDKKVQKDKDVNQAQVEKEARETQLDMKTNYATIDFTKPDNVYKKIKELQDERMRGKFDPKYHQEVLTHILNQVKENKSKVEITLNLLNSMFDAAKVSSQGFMTRDQWITTHNHLENLFTLIESPHMKESIKNFLTRENSRIAEDGDANVDENQNQISTSAEVEKAILPSLANFIEKLDLELLRAYQNTPFSRFEYLLRLRDENKFLHMVDRIYSYLIAHDDKSKAARVAIIKMDHLYSKNDSLYVRYAQAPKEEGNTPYIPEGDSSQVLADLTQLINTHGTARMRFRAALYTVYHLSIHNKFSQAKELLLKTHIADIISIQDVGTQIIYNRAIIQVGQAAFRLGLIEEAHDILVDICQSKKLREILAQGISRTLDKTIETEREEQKRQIPFHMHINLQQLDCIYIITAMLLEIPNVAENQYSVNKRIISKNFKNLIDQYDQKAFQLAPENYKDNLVLAAKELNRSDWRAATKHIFSIKHVTKIPELASETSSFRQNLTLKFKEAALKAFLCRNGKNYQSFGLESLQSQFELDGKQLHKIVSRMIVRQKIHAHFDKSKAILVMDASSSELKELQQLSLQYVDKLEAMVENNERIVDMIGDGKVYGYKERTMGEIQAINASKRQKMMMKQTGGLPNVGQQTSSIIHQQSRR